MSAPLLTIGMPAYNGSASIRDTLNAILQQDFTDFEVYISDDGSTDETPGICLDFERRDSRVHYHREPVNRGATANFNRAFSFCRSEYFMFAADNDLREPTFISECLAALQATSGAVLAFSLFDTIHCHAQRRLLIDDHMNTVGLDQRARLRHVLSNLHWCSAIYGVMRADALRKTRLFRNIWGMDLAVMYQLSLCGSFVKVPRLLFHRQVPCGPEATRRQQWEGFHPANKSRHVFLPDLWLAVELLTFIGRSNEPLAQRLKLISDVGRFSASRRLRW